MEDELTTYFTDGFCIEILLVIESLTSLLSPFRVCTGVENKLLPGVTLPCPF
jgi:hypothetical protein